MREDNEATAKIGLAGYSKHLRHLRRTQKIHLASQSEQLNQLDVELTVVNTLFQNADVLTRAVAGTLWENATKLFSILKTYNILHTSSTGLKMSLEQALAPDAGEDCQAQPSTAPAQVKKNRNQETGDQGGFHHTRKPSRTATPAMCLSNDLSCMSPSTEVMVG